MRAARDTMLGFDEVEKRVGIAEMAGLLRIAASTYLNSAPLVYSFAEGRLRDKAEFLGDTAPARCAEMLAAGVCDAALIPVIEYQRIPGVQVIPGVAVASEWKVRSVLLAARRPLSEVRRVTLDSSSRTSQALVRILCRYRYGIEPEFVERTPDPSVFCENMFEAGDAALVIGDPAIQLAASAGALGVRVYDLAEEWRSLTGLPFVFAVWAVSRDAAKRFPDAAKLFVAAKEEGIGVRELLAARYAEDLGLPKADLLDYLNRNVCYDLDAEKIAGLERFFDLAQACGLIAENRRLVFVREGFASKAGETTGQTE